MHVIAGKAVCAEEALTPEYKEYIEQVVYNTKMMCEAFKFLGYKIVTDGTDNHLFLIDLTSNFPTLSGREVQDFLDTKGITLNKNCIPNERRTPMETSGLRIGCAAMTTKGWDAQRFVYAAQDIDEYIKELATSKEKN